jgi:hypothetical protein
MQRFTREGSSFAPLAVENHIAREPMMDLLVDAIMKADCVRAKV